MLDADDLYHPQKLKIQVSVMNDNPDIYLVGSGICSFGFNVNFIRIRSKGDGKIQLFHNKEPFPVAHASSLLRREHATKFQYCPELLLGQDVDFLSKYLYKKKYINLPDVLYYYSEFDSVTKKKIQKTYKFYMQKYYNSKEYRNCLLYGAKLLYSYVFYPFVNINSILMKRGNLPSNQELADYEKYGFSIVQDLEYQ